jgi:hypothetical protein
MVTMAPRHDARAWDVDRGAQELMGRTPGRHRISRTQIRGQMPRVGSISSAQIFR